MSMPLLETSLTRVAVQVTLMLVPSVLLYRMASRRGPATASWVAGASLAATVVMPVLALIPFPRIGGFEAWRQGEIQARTVSTAFWAVRNTSSEPSSESHGPDRLVELRAFLEGLEVRGIAPWSGRGRFAGAIAWVVVSGSLVGLARLMIGLWIVRTYLRRSTLVDDPRLLDSLHAVSRSIGVIRFIEVRELPDLPSAATAGWRRPLILLPSDWSSWSDGDLRAVLAHEAAHIARGDYAAGVISRLALALHFYHPLVRWMANRLLEQQELAADEIGARHGGGRRAYLAALSRMALRQDGSGSYWPATAFLPARGNLIRRIEMLRKNEGCLNRAWSPAGRRVVLASLAVLGLAAWGIVGVVWGEVSDEGPRLAVQSLPGAKAESSATVPAFDLTYVPVDAMGVVAFRPAATFRRKGMGMYPAQLNAFARLHASDIEQGLGVPLAKCPLKAEQIEQVILALSFGRTTHKGKELRRFWMHCVTVRTVEPFDWRAQLREWWPDLEEMHEGSRVYYKLKPGANPMLGKAPSFLVVDDRTLVCDEEPVILSLIRRDVPSPPGFAHSADWERVQHDLFAAALNDHDGRLSRVTRRTVEPGEADDFPDFVEGTDRWVFGLADADEFLLRASAACRDSRIAEALTRRVTNLCNTWIDELENLKPENNTHVYDVVRYAALGSQVLKGLRISVRGSTVQVEPGPGVELAELLPLIVRNGS